MDFLKVFNNSDTSGNFGFQMKGFLMSLATLKKSVHDEKTGHVDESDYSKNNLYGFLYNLYDIVGEIKDEKGQTYQFTFNTWGFWHPESIIPQNDPQIFGKTAYSIHFTRDDHVKAKIKQMENIPKIMELGCGTGAGAHLICSDIFPNFYNIKCEYMAIDMQKAAINTAKKKT